MGVFRWVIALLILFCCKTYSDIAILHSHKPRDQRIANLLKESLKPSNAVRQLSTISKLKKPNILVPIGVDIPSEAQHIQALVIPFATHAAVKEQQNRPYTSYFIMDAPSPAAVVAFFNQNFTSATVGYIYNEHDEAYAREIEKLMKPGPNSLAFAEFNGNSNEALKRLIKSDIDVLFISPNYQVYNRSNIRIILNLCFIKKIPAIATKKSIARAGALASISASNNHIIDTTALVMRRLEAGNKPSINQFYSGHYEVYVNPKIETFFNRPIQRGQLND